MYESKKKDIIHKLTSIIKEMPDESDYRAHPSPRWDMPVKNGEIRLVGDGYIAFNDLCDIFLGEKDWKEKFSREYIEEEVIFSLLNSALFSSDTGYLQHELEAIVSKCDNYKEEHTAYIPIVGLNMNVDQLVLGKITLRNMEGAHFKTFAQEVESEILRRETLHELDVWHTFTQHYIKDKIVAFYSTEAEPKRTQELAELECNHVIDILRYFANIKNRSINVRLPLEITERTLLEMQQEGIYDLIVMHRSLKKKSFNDTLLFGIHWFVNALMQDDPANEFLGLAVCLETFLTPGDTAKSISNAIAVGIAWVLGKNFAERQDLYSKMKKHYNRRSSITHSGQKDISPHELLDFRETVKAFLQVMVQRRDEFNTGKENALQSWINGKELGSP